MAMHCSTLHGVEDNCRIFVAICTFAACLLVLLIPTPTQIHTHGATSKSFTVERVRKHPFRVQNK